MDTNDQQPLDPASDEEMPVGPPAAMPLSMPPVTAAVPVTDPAAGGEHPTGTAAPIGAMPLSMPPYHPTTELPAVGPPPAAAPGSGGESPSWTSGIGWASGAIEPSDPARAAHGRRGLVAVVVAALLAGGIGAGLGVSIGSNNSSSGAENNALSSPAAPATPSAPTKALSASAIYKLITPSVVDINTVIASPASQGPSSQAAGTGMIVSSNGVILTNNHVIKDATQIQVSIAGRSQMYPATVIGTSVKNDIALLKVAGVSGLPTVSFGNSSAVQIGDSAIAVGNAGGLGGSPTLARGEISALGRTITAGDTASAATETLHNLIETNAQIQPGDSGGPLINSKGQVIGMDTAAFSADTTSSLGFAIPINQAKQVATSIEVGKVTAANGVVVGLSPFLGVFSSPTGAGNPFGSSPIGFGNTQACSLSGTSAPVGAAISDVISGGPAARAGLTGGDTITAVNGQHITDWTGLSAVVSTLKPNAKVPLTYADSCGVSHSTTATIGGVPA